MVVRMKAALICSMVILAGSGCSKFRKLTESEKFTEVTFAGGKRNGLVASQSGGVMIWGSSPGGERFALALLDETEEKTVRLRNGAWSFFSTGWTGADYFEGTVRCATTQENLAGQPITIELSLATGQCGGSLFGDGQYVSAGTPLPLRITTCRSGPMATITDGDDTDCTGASNIGPYRAFKVRLNEYAPTATDSHEVLDSLTTSCKINPNWGSGTANFDLPSVQIPAGSASGSAIDTTILAYPDPTCSASPTEFRFPRGLAAGSAYTTDLYPGTAPASSSLYILGPSPSISSLTPNTGAWGGGTSVVLTGTYLFPDSVVKLNGKTCNTTASGLTSITCTTPHSLSSGAATIEVDNTLGVTTLPTTTPFTYQEDDFGNASDSEMMSIGASPTISTSANWSNSASLSTRVGSASRNVSNVALGSGYSELTFSSAFTSDDFAVNDEVMWHVSAASSDTACSSSSDLPAGKFGFGRVSLIDTSNSKIRIKTTITSTPNNTNMAATSRSNADTFCVLQAVRVPNFKNLTLDSTSGLLQITKGSFSFANGHGGIIALRVAGNLTVTGTNDIWLYAKDLGFPGGAGATHPFQGGSRRGLGLSSSGGQLPNSDTGGAPGDTRGAGGGGNYGDGGDGGGTPFGGKGIGLTSCALAQNCALFGGGGGGGNLAGSDGGAGAGIIMLFAKNILGSGLTGNFQLWNGGGGGAGGGTATFSAGGGGGGTTYVVTQNAATASLGIIGAGGHADSGGSITHGGGGGGGGVAKVRECFATKLASLSVDVGGGNNGGGTFGGNMGSAGNPVADHDDQISSGSEFCP